MPRGAMHDLVKVLTEGTAVAPEHTAAYTPGSAIRCRFSHGAGEETTDGAQAQSVDGQIRIQKGTTVTGKNRLNLTKFQGAVVSRFFEIVGTPQPAGRRTEEEIVCDVKELMGTTVV